MSDHVFTFRLVTPQRLVFQGTVASLLAPGSEGYLGVLAHHAPLITSLRPGRLEVKDEAGKASTYAVSGGFLEISGNRATMLADAAEPVREIDRERAERALRRAETRLRGAPGEPAAAGERAGAGGPGGPGTAAFDRERAQRAYERAKNRLTIAGT